MATLSAAETESLSIASPIRGVAVALPGSAPSQVSVWKGWGANTIRAMLVSDRDSECAILSPQGYAAALEELDSMIEAARDAGVEIIVSIKAGCRGRFWHDPEARLALVRFWRLFMSNPRWIDSPIIGIDFLNEPNWEPGTKRVWFDELLPTLYQTLRAYSRDLWAVVEPGPWGRADGFADMPEFPADDRRVLYSFHHYSPRAFTHTGVRSEPRIGVRYPGKIRSRGRLPTESWNRNRIAKSMEVAVRVSRAHQRPMLVGEVGVIRWAVGSDLWLADSLTTIDANGFGWMIHSPTGWNGWNPGVGGSAKARVWAVEDGYESTDRMKVLRRFMGGSAREDS